VRGVALRRCPCCGLRWWDFARVDAEQLYGEEYFRGSGSAGYDDYYALRPGLERTGRMRLGRIASELGLEHGRLLDVGCGPGFFLAAARAAGWNVEGIEISAAACRFAREELRLPVRCSPVTREAIGQSGFDLVTLWDVLEHLPDPALAIAAAAGALRRGAGLVLSTGDVESLAARVSGARWHLYNFPEHLYFHTERSVRRLLERAGLRVRATRREPIVVSAGYALERLQKTLLGGRARIKPGWLERVWLPINLWDVMTVYAERS